MSYKQLGNQNFNNNINKQRNDFAYYDDLSILSIDESVISDSDNDEDEMSEGYEEIYEILENNQPQKNLNKSYISYSTDEMRKNTLPPIKPTSISQTSYVAFNNNNTNQPLYYYNYGHQNLYQTIGMKNYYSNYGYTTLNNSNQNFKLVPFHQYANSLVQFTHQNNRNNYYNNMHSNSEGKSINLFFLS